MSERDFDMAAVHRWLFECFGDVRVQVGGSTGIAYMLEEAARPLRAQLSTAQAEIDALRAQLTEAKDARDRAEDPSGYELRRGHTLRCARVRHPNALFPCDCGKDRKP